MFGCQEAWGNGTMHSGKRTYVVTWWRGLRASRCVALALASGFRNFEHLRSIVGSVRVGRCVLCCLIDEPFLAVPVSGQCLCKLSQFKGVFDATAHEGARQARNDPFEDGDCRNVFAVVVLGPLVAMQAL